MSSLATVHMTEEEPCSRSQCPTTGSKIQGSGVVGAAKVREPRDRTNPNAADTVQPSETINTRICLLLSKKLKHFWVRLFFLTVV